jgi:two-component system chemotaxis response regulator CheB
MTKLESGTGRRPETARPGHPIIVIGASAGGVEALTRLVAALPPDFPAAILVVLHVPPHGDTALPQILSRRGPLPARHAEDGEPIRPGTIYVAPPNRHLLVRDGAIRLSLGPTENGHRPGIDPLFRTAARAYGPRVVGVVLSGMLDDGSAGLVTIKQRGGVAVVQQPEDALFPGMPRSALELVEVDHCLPVAEMAPLLARLAQDPEPSGIESPVPEDLEMEARIDEFDLAALEDDVHRPGSPSAFGCPDCGGVLWEQQEGKLDRFRCRVGHSWSALNLLAEQSHALEDALWVALRALEEKAALANRLASRMSQLGNDRSAAAFRTRAEAARSQAVTLRRVLLDRDPDTAVRASLLEPEGSP